MKIYEKRLITIMIQIYLFVYKINLRLKNIITMITFINSKFT